MWRITVRDYEPALREAGAAFAKDFLCSILLSGSGSGQGGREVSMVSFGARMILGLVVQGCLLLLRASGFRVFALRARRGFHAWYLRFFKGRDGDDDVIESCGNRGHLDALYLTGHGRHGRHG